LPNTALILCSCSGINQVLKEFRHITPKQAKKKKKKIPSFGHLNDEFLAFWLSLSCTIMMNNIKLKKKKVGKKKDINLT
jgi:hypothetical protein